jgi:hypothetical protein
MNLEKNMISAIILAIIGTIHGVRVFRRSKGSSVPYPLWVTAPFFCLVGAASGFFIAFLITSGLPERPVISNPVALAPLGSEGLTQDFIFNSGSIVDGFTYHFIEITKDGTIKPVQVSGTNIRIIEDPTLKGVGYWTTISKVAYKPEGFNFFTFGTSVRNTTVMLEELRVPVGSLAQQYEIDGLH